VVYFLKNFWHSSVTWHTTFLLSDGSSMTTDHLNTYKLLINSNNTSTLNVNPSPVNEKEVVPCFHIQQNCHNLAILATFHHTYNFDHTELIICILHINFIISVFSISLAMNFPLRRKIGTKTLHIFPELRLTDHSLLLFQNKQEVNSFIWDYQCHKLVKFNHNH
jgi:hypothetical protein